MKRCLVLLCMVAAACSFPKDPEGSLARARQSALRVGIVHNPPYTFFADGKPGGSEVAIMESFARAEGLKTQYTYGTESVLVKELESYKLDVIIGGFTKKTVWKDKAGLTTAYNHNNNCMLVAKGENELLYHLETYLLKHKQ